MLNFRRLMLLRDLAELGTVTAVAERRNITSSAVSSQLRVLEDEVSAVLFRRDGRNLRLTESGETLVSHAREILRVVDEATSAVARTRDRNGGRIALSGFETSIPGLAAPLLHRLRRDKPELTVRVVQAPTPVSLRSLRHGDTDVALTSRLDFRAADPLSGLHSHALLRDPLVLLAPAAVALRVRTVGLRSLADEAWITGPQDTGLAEALTLLGERHGFTPKIEHRVVGAPNMCQLAAIGGAVALVPRMSVPPTLESMIVDGFDVGSRTIDVVHREGALENPAVSVVVQTLRDIAHQRVAAATTAS
ncbi:LysR family transcriptional regulator [Rhodococcoides yunnanense]|uniref:LysR family transcriptional regulator n=1 Tax=Rhodococcoides yunnanense TaxID=278209 RepID=UPI000932E1EC|nr:LysR family transcriptional regulator [Rhodococcus yunnanensis]